jgi:hypothetical protein
LHRCHFRLTSGTYLDLSNCTLKVMLSMDMTDKDLAQYLSSK